MSMRFCVIRHPDVVNAGVIPETALEHHEAHGWTQVSDWSTDVHSLHPESYPAPEPQAETQAPETQPANKAAAKNKESS